MAAAPRIVSLVPSLTELVFALGLGPLLVGRTGFCVHPAAEVAGVPKLGGTKQVDEAALLALRPTHLIVNKDENEAPLVERLSRHVDELIITHPLTVNDNLVLFEQFSRCFAGIDGVAARADTMAAALRQELQASLELRAMEAEIAVRYLIWKDPWMSVADNTYIASMLDSAGLRNTLPPRLASRPAAETGASRYPVLTAEEVVAADCAHLLLSSEPFRFTERHRKALQQDVDRARVEAPSAHARVSGPQVHLIDGELCSWYGPRAIEGLRYLRRCRQHWAGAQADAPLPQTL